MKKGFLKQVLQASSSLDIVEHSHEQPTRMKIGLLIGQERSE